MKWTNDSWNSKREKIVEGSKLIEKQCSPRMCIPTFTTHLSVAQDLINKRRFCCANLLSGEIISIFKKINIRNPGFDWARILISDYWHRWEIRNLSRSREATMYLRPVWSCVRLTKWNKDPCFSFLKCPLLDANLWQRHNLLTFKYFNFHILNKLDKTKSRLCSCWLVWM